MSNRNDRNGRALQGYRNLDRCNLDRWTVGAGAGPIEGLLALTGRSVVRAPDEVWAVGLPVVAPVMERRGSWR